MILVTGATGSIGSSRVKALKEKGARFKVGSRSPNKLEGQGVEAVLFDWDKPETFGPALQGVEKVFLLTPVSEKQTHRLRGARAGQGGLGGRARRGRGGRSRADREGA